MICGVFLMYLGCFEVCGDFALLCLAIVLIGAIASIVFPDVNTSGLLTSLF